MPIITLTTDMGLKDHYVAAIKGAILTHIDQIQIIDITHEVQSFSILQATFVLQNCFKDCYESKRQYSIGKYRVDLYFPKKSS